MKFFKHFMVLVTLSFISALSTQVYSQSSIGLGIEGGVNMANINVTPNFTTNGRTGILIGAFADIGLSRTIYLRPGIRYVSKGFSNTDNGITYTDKLSYLEIPALLKVSFPLTEVKPYLLAGPTLGIQLSANEEATDGVQVQTADASSIYESIDFGLYFGAGVDFHVSKVDMFVGGGYSMGLSNIVKQTNISGKNYGFQLTGGIKFNL